MAEEEVENDENLHTFCIRFKEERNMIVPYLI